LIAVGESVTTVARRRRRFKDQSILGIVWHMLSSLDSAPAGRLVSAEDAGKDVPASPGLPAGDRRSTVLPRPLVIASAAILVVLLAVAVIVLTNLTTGGTSSTGAAATALALTPAAPTPQATLALSPSSGAPLIQVRTLGSGLLLQPQDALRMPDGDVAVADTGHHRVLLLSSAGKLMKAITQGGGGPLQTPFSLALMHGGRLLVLDSDEGQVDEYTAGGTLMAASNLALHLTYARDIAVDAAGQVIIADPAMNAVVTLDGNLAFVRAQEGESGAGDNPFNQPSAVAAAADGSLYVVDSQFSRLAHYSATWALLQQWPIAVPDTQHSPRVLALADGRLLASDPLDNALLLYDPSIPQPQSFPLTGGGEPLGLAPGGHGDVLVTCSSSGEVLDVDVPGLKL
jgi:hypothetical protein